MAIRPGRRRSDAAGGGCRNRQACDDRLRKAQLSQPRRVAVDAAGNVYVSDTQNHRIQEFGPDGGFRTQWRRCEDDPAVCEFPNSGGGPGEFFYARSAVIDAGGDLYLADTSNRRVQRLIQTAPPPAQIEPPPYAPDRARTPRSLAFGHV